MPLTTYPSPYNHEHYAGGLEDVIVHTLLAELLKPLSDTELTYAETHAGAGEYKLMVPPSAETVSRVAGTLYSHPNWRDNTLVNLLRAINDHASGLKTYLGSPMIALNILRRVQVAYLVEIATPASDRLKSLTAERSEVCVINGNGYEIVPMLCASKGEAEFFVYIDPSYESADELEKVLAAVATCMDNSNAHVAVTFPASTKRDVEQAFDMASVMARSGLLVRAVAVQFHSESPRLSGAGLMSVRAKKPLERLPTWLMSRLIRDLELDGAHLLTFEGAGKNRRC